MIMPPEQVCNKHDETMTRLFSKIEENEKAQAIFVAEVKGYIQNTNSFIQKADKVLFGDERGNGIITQLKVLLKHVSIQWTLIIIILGGIVGIGIKMVWGG